MKKYSYILMLALGFASVCVADAAAQRYGSRSQSRQVEQRGRRMDVKASGGNVVREVHNVGNFSAVNARGIADVEYRQSRDGRARVEVYGTANLVEYIEVRNVRGVLEIGWSQNVNPRGNYRLVVRVSSPGVNRMSTTGTGDIRITGQLDARMLELSTLGTGDIEFDRILCEDLRIVARGTGDVEGSLVKARTLNIGSWGSGDVDISKIDVNVVEVAMSGTGDTDIDGRTREAVFKLRGTGDLDASGLRAVVVDATLSGTGDIECRVEQYLRVTASGVGRLVYRGNPGTVDVRGNKRAVRRK